jgi:hypothetical protein
MKFLKQLREIFEQTLTAAHLARLGEYKASARVFK